MYHKGGREVVVNSPEEEANLGEGWRVEQWPSPSNVSAECANCTRQAEIFDASWKQLMADRSSLAVEHEALKAAHAAQVEDTLLLSNELTKQHTAHQDLQSQHAKLIEAHDALALSHAGAEEKHQAAERQIAALQLELDEATKDSKKKPAKTA